MQLCHFEGNLNTVDQILAVDVASISQKISPPCLCTAGFTAMTNFSGEMHKCHTRVAVSNTILFTPNGSTADASQRKYTTATGTVMQFFKEVIQIQQFVVQVRRVLQNKMRHTTLPAGISVNLPRPRAGKIVADHFHLTLIFYPNPAYPKSMTVSCMPPSP